jgi:hypothetical protein
MLGITFFYHQGIIMKTINCKAKQFALLVTLLCVSFVTSVHAKKSDIDASKFLTVYPGIYTEREQPLIDVYLKQNAAIEARGQIDVQKLITGELPEDTPGLGPVIKVTEEWLKYNASKYVPANPLYNSKKYAKKAGYKDLFAFPVFGAHDDTFMTPYPAGARDTLLVSELNHDVKAYVPIYAGDTLYLVMNSRRMIDMTPQEGSIYRNVGIISTGSVYNQNGEKVNDVTFRVVESVKQYAKPEYAPKNPSFLDFWEAPNWLAREAHYYSDEDWDRIKEIWKNEKIQGAKPLYWEDVKVGDRPTPTLDGPIEASVAPIPPWGMGAGGSRTMKAEILKKRTFKKMIRGEKDGIYRLKNKEDYIPEQPTEGSMSLPPMPAGDEEETGAIVTTDIHKDGVERSPLVNYMGRDFALRHVINWMGDKGVITRIRWSIMDPRGHADKGKPVPGLAEAEHFLDEVPDLKGRYVSEHGLTQDVAYVQSYVTDKYVEDGKFLVDLVWWVETLNGDIWQEGKTTVKLPSRSQQ